MSDDDYRKIFTKKLNYYMELNDKNQMDLMKDLGLSSSTVSNWCTGLKLPRMGKIQLLADYFGINKSDLIEDKSDSTEENNHLTNDETDLIHIYRKLNTDGKQKLVERADELLTLGYTSNDAKGKLA